MVWMIFLSWIVTLVLQFAIRRRRPYECLIYEAKVKLFCKTPSFPSAHAAIAFTILWSMFFNEMTSIDFIFVLFFLVAIWISVSRVAVGVHYVSDIIAGALLGIIVPTLFYFFGYLWLTPLFYAS
jgi:undecaprenyl-diphosphatase